MTLNFLTSIDNSYDPGGSDGTEVANHTDDELCERRKFAKARRPARRETRVIARRWC
jgi:hypothetical protein